MDPVSVKRVGTHGRCTPWGEDVQSGPPGPLPLHRQGQLHGECFYGECFYNGLYEPLEETERRIREMAAYIDDAQRRAAGEIA